MLSGLIIKLFNLWGEDFFGMVCVVCEFVIFDVFMEKGIMVLEELVVVGEVFFVNF